MGEVTRIILWGRDDIICQGVELFLKTRSDYEVSRVTGENNYESLIQEIKRSNADVVIINPGHHLHDPRIPLRLMKTCSGIKVITLDLEDSAVDVYNKQKVCMKQVSDLLDIVKKEIR